MEWLSKAATVLVLLVSSLAAWYYRRKALTAEQALQSRIGAESAAVAEDATKRVESLELERAKRVVEVFAEAQKEAKNVTPADGAARERAALDRLRH